MNEKSIYFCNIEWDKVSFNGRYSRLTDLLSEYFDESNNYTLELNYKNRPLIVNLEINDTYIFGLYSLVSDFRSEMARAIDRENNIVNLLDYKLEYYSFFYIDLESFNLAYIYNQHLPDIRDLFPSIIRGKKHLNMYYFTVDNIKDDNAAKRSLGLSKQVFYGRLKGINTTRLHDASYIDTDHFDYTYFEVRFKPKRRMSATAIEDLTRRYDSLKLEGNIVVPAGDRYTQAKKEIINLIKRTYSRKATIDTKNITMDNTDFIKDYLRNELLVALNSQNIQNPGAEESNKNADNEQISI